MTNRTPEDLDTGLAYVLDAPRGDGEIVMIVRRPGEDAREVLDEGVIDLETSWGTTGRRGAILAPKTAQPTSSHS